MTALVPWNAAWSGEQRYEIRPCRWAGGNLAIWSPHNPRIGRPLFAKPHAVRQRRSVAQFLCTVCGEHTPPDDRWWFKLGEFREGWFMTTEAPVHKACGELALEHCPHLKSCGCASDFSPFPRNYQVLSSIVGGSDFDRDFSAKINGRRVVGALKFAWPEKIVRRRRGEPNTWA